MMISRQLPQPLRIALSMTLIGVTGFFIMANSAGPEEIYTLNSGTYDAKSTCGGEQAEAQVTITTLETGADCSEIYEQFCSYELVLPFESLGITDTSYQLSDSNPKYGYLSGTVGNTAVACKDLYYSDLGTHILDCRPAATDEALCVITLKRAQ